MVGNNTKNTIYIIVDLPLKYITITQFEIRNRLLRKPIFTYKVIDVSLLKANGINLFLDVDLCHLGRFNTFC